MSERKDERLEQLMSHSGPQALPTMNLIQQIIDDARALANMEVELAKAEARLDLHQEIEMAKSVTAGAVCAIVGITMVIVAAVVGWAPNHVWEVSLIVGVILLVIGSILGWLGWQRAEKNPFWQTRTSIKEDMEWAKKQIRQESGVLKKVA